MRLNKEKSINAEFLRENELRSQFINIISNKLDKDTKISIKKKIFIIENNEICQYFKLYSLKFIQENSTESILSIFFNLINDLGIKGILIINFSKLIQGTIIYSCFFVEYFSKINEKENLLNKIEEFISNDLILKEKIMKWNLIGNLLWRLWFFKDYLYFKKTNLIFALNTFVQRENNSNTSNTD